MSNWFQKQREDFIRSNLKTYGMIRRQQIADKFGVTIAVASKDLQDFIAANPGLIDYDRRAKCYTLDRNLV